MSFNDIIVVGGGAAGLAAADHLSRSGVKVTLVEARDRMGGRILTQKLSRSRWHAEFGPEFVHGGNALLRAALRRAGIRLKLVPRNFWVLKDGQFRQDKHYWKQLAHVAGKISAGTSASMAHVVRRITFPTPSDRERLLAFVEGFNAAPANRFSAAVFRAEDGGAQERQSRPDAGYGRLVDSYVSLLRTRGVKFERRFVVETISWSKGEVEVRSTRGRKLSGRAAVITLPLGVLRTGSVCFNPPLRRKADIIKRLGWGHVARVTLLFEKRAWLERIVPATLQRRGRVKFGFLSTPSEPFPTWWTPDPASSLLVGWVGGPQSAGLQGMSETQLRSIALRSLSASWKVPLPTLRKACRACLAHDWSKDPFTRGAYSYATAGFDRGPELLAQPVAQTLFFAGEATAEEIATVHGALASGVRAAREILDKLGR